MASRLRVSLEKSKFMASKNVLRTKIVKFTSIIGFSNTTKLDRYLGFPFFSGGVKKRDFDFILDNIKEKLIG